MKSQNSRAFFPGLAAATLAILSTTLMPACNSLDRAVNGPVEALVVLPSAGGGHEQYLVPASANGACKSAVREMRSEEWDKAITGFKQALLDDPDDDCAHFGLGIAYEVTGKLEDALVQYQAADRIPRSPVPMYGDAIKRVRAKLGK